MIVTKAKRKKIKAPARPNRPEAHASHVATKPGTTTSAATTQPTPQPDTPKAALPESYGTKQLLLIARDPRWLYAQWDFTMAEQRQLNRQAAAGHLAVRIFAGSTGGKPIKHSNLAKDARYAFLPVASGPASYIAELGYLNRAKKWVTVAQSKPVKMPPAALQPEQQALFATIPLNVPFARIKSALRTVAPVDAPLVDALELFHNVSGGAVFPGVFLNGWTNTWLPEQDLLAEELFPSDAPGSSDLAHGREIKTDSPAKSPRMTQPELEEQPTSPGGAWSGIFSLVEE